jgi:hypothetical protein
MGPLWRAGTSGGGSQRGRKEDAMSWKVVVGGGNLEFSSAHFITFEGECEPLHGHN